MSHVIVGVEVTFGVTLVRATLVLASPAPLWTHSVVLSSVVLVVVVVRLVLKGIGITWKTKAGLPRQNEATLGLVSTDALNA